MYFNFKKFLYFLTGFLLFIVVYQGFVKAEFDPKYPLEVNFLDVGQGDAVLISYLNERQILIDAGKNGKKTLNEIKKQMPPGDNKIEIVVATHPDMDHIGGMDEVFENYQVEMFLDNGFRDDGGQFKKIEEILKRQNIENYDLFEGSKIALGNHLSLKVYNPDDRNYNKGDKNEDSVVLKMDFGKNSFLFTGDINKNTEADILSDGEDVDADWLKVAHHGSKSSSSAEFIQKVSPEFSIISFGKDNSYGHPHKEVVKRLELASSEVLNTAEYGTVEVACSGTKKDCFLAE